LEYCIEGENKLANIESAKKRILVTDKKELQNKVLTSKLKTTLKKYDAAIKTANIELAKSLLSDTLGFIDILEHKGIIHKNNAARKKASVNKKLFSLTKTETAKAE